MKTYKALVVAGATLGVLIAPGNVDAALAQGAPADSGPVGGEKVKATDDDRVGAGDVLVVGGDYGAAGGASLVLKDADGTTGSLTNGTNADFEQGEGSLRVSVAAEPEDLVGGDGELSTKGLAVESSDGITQGPPETTAPETTAPETTAPETTDTGAAQPGVLGPEGEPEGTNPTSEGTPGGETPEGRPVEIAEESAVDAGDVLLVGGSYETEEGASLVLADADGTSGALVDGENAEFSAGEDGLEVVVAGNVLELSGGDGELTLEGLAVESSEGIVAADGETDTGSTVPEETTALPEPETTEQEEPETTEQEEPETTEQEEPETTEQEGPETETTDRTASPEGIPVGGPLEDPAEDPEGASPTEPTEETTALPETTAFPEETTALPEPETTALPEETTQGTVGPSAPPEGETTEKEAPDVACAGAIEIESYTGSAGQTTAPFETAGGSFRVLYEIAGEGATDDLAETTADGGGATGGEFGLTIRAVEAETGERVAEETADAVGTGEMMVEAGPGLYALELAPAGAEYGVLVEDCQDVSPPPEAPTEGTGEEGPTPDEITQRFGDPGRIVEEEREEPPTIDDDTMLPTRLPETGGAAAVVLPVASVLLGTGVLAGAILRRLARGR